MKFTVEEKRVRTFELVVIEADPDQPCNSSPATPEDVIAALKANPKLSYEALRAFVPAMWLDDANQAANQAMSRQQQQQLPPGMDPFKGGAR